MTRGKPMFTRAMAELLRPKSQSFWTRGLIWSAIRKAKRGSEDSLSLDISQRTLSSGLSYSTQVLSFLGNPHLDDTDRIQDW